MRVLIENYRYFYFTTEDQSEDLPGEDFYLSIRSDYYVDCYFLIENTSLVKIPTNENYNHKEESTTDGHYSIERSTLFDKEGNPRRVMILLQT